MVTMSLPLPVSLGLATSQVFDEGGQSLLKRTFSGNFHSIRKPNATYGGKVKFPRMQMQVFEVHRGKFGPEWECGELISIGLWVGILVTLFFATICFWGFSMLASINVRNTV